MVINDVNEVVEDLIPGHKAMHLDGNFNVWVFFWRILTTHHSSHRGRFRI